MINYVNPEVAVSSIQSHQRVFFMAAQLHPMQYEVTESGLVNLYGKNLRQCACELMGIAHPDYREILEKAILERFGSFVYPFR